MSMANIIAEQARLIMLRALDEQPSARLNSDLLIAELEGFGITKTRDWVHEELRCLAEIGAVRVVDAGSVRVAHLTDKGRDHVERRIVLEGVKRPSPVGL
ncbi:hypothetical protein C2U72_00115 [Prosthecomicrobium hirschii]|uniref:VpaChn25_0724 family phage protein n=1 Tax=Prosthecodimorpha hirschii TaxID=665126 RepID=UPI00112D3F95|nr:hypothetical protein [Prosthecomicrobium hirschii]TPQ53034.1 hypothetical protein C2U72_00115 [Prosthecomicrobium hirschii]